MRIPHVLPVDKLRDALDYDPTTGELRWKETGSGRSPDFIAGSGGCHYLSVCVDHINYSAHRVAFAIFHGRAPSGEIDHVDGNPRNNAISNLREATRVQNNWNMRGWSPYGKGVTKDPRRTENPFRARIRTKHGRRNLGVFATPELARAAYLAAETTEFGEFAFSARPTVRAASAVVREDEG